MWPVLDLLPTGKPSVGLGCWKIPGDVTANIVLEAIRLGYRHLDCACDYGNEKQVEGNLVSLFFQNT